MEKFSKLESKSLDEEFRLKLSAPVTVGDLKKLLSNIDDDKQVIVYNSGYDSNSWFYIKIDDGKKYDKDDDIVLIYVN